MPYTNTKLLKSQMTLKGVTTKALADALGCGMSTIYRRINGETAFTVPEVLRVKDLLDLDTPTMNEIFFAADLS